MLQKSETNNAIVAVLANVRKHPNADRIKLATVLGTQVVVGLDAKDGEVVIYFDSNLRLSHEYLHHNNLYSNKELNQDTSVKGYFGKNGRVRAQKFRGEVSNGYVAEMGSLIFPGAIQHYDELELQEGDEFTHINGVKICEKYIIPIKHIQGKSRQPVSEMFHKHWDTKQFMRESEKIAPGILFIEEKIHGTSGRTGKVLCRTEKKWWQFWKPETEWKVVSGTRRTDRIDSHMAQERKEIHEKLAPHLHQGEQLYYEIYGYELSGKCIQKGFPYDCKPREYKVMLYRATLTSPDGHSIDLSRERVYKRAEELGLEKPVLLEKRAVGVVSDFGYSLSDSMQDEWVDDPEWEHMAATFAQGKSSLDAGTLREGFVVWFQDKNGNWDCLKHKSEEFLIHESKLKDENINDVEDNL